MDGRTAMAALAAALAMGIGAEGRAASKPAVVVVEIDHAVARALQALGPEVVFFTARNRPLRTLADIRSPGEEMGTGDLGLVRPLLPLLRAGGVKVSGGALDLMRLVSPAHFSSVFSEHPRLRLFALRRRGDAAEQVVATRGGGAPVVFRVAGEPAVAAVPDAAVRRRSGASDATFVTSFGPLVEAALTTTARTRSFDPLEGPREEVLPARPGHHYVVLRIDRDFGAGQGVVGFLFGSGTILKPEFDRLELRDAAGRRYPLTATHAEGRALELAYAVPTSARALLLVDGDRRHPLQIPSSPARAALGE
jgi:hypothetical protein